MWAHWSKNKHKIFVYFHNQAHSNFCSQYRFFCTNSFQMYIYGSQYYILLHNDYKYLYLAK